MTPIQISRVQRLAGSSLRPFNFVSLLERLHSPAEGAIDLPFWGHGFGGAGEGVLGFPAPSSVAAAPRGGVGGLPVYSGGAAVEARGKRQGKRCRLRLRC